VTDDSAGDVGNVDRTPKAETLARITNRDLPLLKGTIRGLAAEDVETVEDFPAAGRSLRAELDSLAERVAALEDRVAALGDVGTNPSTKEEKYAAVLAFAANKNTSTGKVAVTPSEVQGCTGVSRRYAYDLIEAMDDTVDGVRVREATQVQTGSGVEQKGKALLVDCDRVHATGDGVNQFTTGVEAEQER
jgi:hypothetical protein